MYSIICCYSPHGGKYPGIGRVLVMRSCDDAHRWPGLDPATELLQNHSGVSQGGIKLLPTKVFRLWWRGNTSNWITVHLSSFNGADLGVQEWRDDLFLWYRIEPPDLPKKCNKLGAIFSISHALDFNRVGLITTNHNKLRERVAKLAINAFLP